MTLVRRSSNFGLSLLPFVGSVVAGVLALILWIQMRYRISYTFWGFPLQFALSWENSPFRIVLINPWNLILDLSFLILFSSLIGVFLEKLKRRDLRFQFGLISLLTMFCFSCLFLLLNFLSSRTVMDPGFGIAEKDAIVVKYGWPWHFFTSTQNGDDTFNFNAVLVNAFVCFVFIIWAGILSEVIQNKRHYPTRSLPASLPPKSPSSSDETKEK